MVAWIRRHEIVLAFVLVVVASFIATWQVEENLNSDIDRANKRITQLCNQFTHLKRVEISFINPGSIGISRADTAVVKLLRNINCDK